MMISSITLKRLIRKSFPFLENLLLKPPKKFFEKMLPEINPKFWD